MLVIIVGYVVATLFTAFCLWAAMKITKVEGNFPQILVIALVSCLALFLLPGFGRLVAILVMGFLIWRWIGADLWPDTVLMVIVARLVSMLALIALHCISTSL